MKQMENHNNAFFLDRPSCVTDSEGNDLFAPAPKRRIAAIGAITNGGPLCATALPAIVDELDFMEIDLLAVRVGLRESVQTLTPAQLYEMENENIGHDIDIF